MKKILLLSVTAATMLLSVGCKQTHPDSLEGEITKISSWKAPGPKATAITQYNEASLKNEDGTEYTIWVTATIAEEFISETCTTPSRYYVRLTKNAQGVYEKKELAYLNYDHGTPPIYEFLSDKKRAGYYK